MQIPTSFLVIENIEQWPLQFGRKQVIAKLDVAAKLRLGVEELARHSDVLRTLSGEQECNPRRVGRIDLSVRATPKRASTAVRAKLFTKFPDGARDHA